MDSLDKTANSHQTGAEQHDPEGKGIGKRALINKLNYINFQDRTILISLQHVKYGNTISLQAKPLPCSSDRLDCVLSELPVHDRILTVYKVVNFLIDDGRKLLLVEPQATEITGREISFVLPETCRELRSRKTKRHPATGITARLIQNGVEFLGFLKDFSAVSFCVEFEAAPPRAFHWIDADSSVHLSCSAGEEAFYSGECRIIRQECSDSSGSFVLEPLQHHLRRFKSKEYRTERQALVPSPYIDFKHPLIKVQASLKVIDLSGSGLSVEEEAGESILLPGLIIPQLAICFANSLKIYCTAQVVYRNPAGEEHNGGQVKCGLTILDMDVADHVRLMAILHQAADSNSYLCPNVNQDALWEFFFETGFIYPEKYSYLQADREEMKHTYDLLYNGRPGIGRHFIYQQRGKILGHMAMLRCYNKSWLIHHHAAGKSESSKAGLMVLNQISRYVNDIHHLRSAHLNYVFCYFRPENRFPNRVFGEFSIKLNDLQGCSLDTFAYFHFQRAAEDKKKPAGQWELSEASPADLEELKGFYRQESGGLMLDAFDLGAGGAGHDTLAEEYRELGFKKERHLLALRQEGDVKAFIMANVSDIGLNMSNLTNCATVMVLDDTLPRNVLESALSTVAAKYERNSMPVLLYPVSYSEQQSLPCEKMYTLWVLSLQYLDHYFKFCDALFNSNHKKHNDE